MKVMLLTETAQMPSKAYQGDGGWDLYCDEDALIIENAWLPVKTGIAVAIPEGFVGVIKPRSGLSVKLGYDILAGVIDSQYRGEIKVVIAASNQRIGFKKGDKIAQMLILPVNLEPCEKVDSLPDTDRGIKGWGSSGN